MTNYKNVLSGQTTRDSWGGTNIMVWNGIGLSFKLGPVIFQNIGSGRENGVTVARYTLDILSSGKTKFLHD
jgi:hypothetical protein